MAIAIVLSAMSVSADAQQCLHGPNETNGYWFMIKGTTDSCGFAYISNQAGVLYTSEPLR